MTGPQLSAVVERAVNAYNAKDFEKYEQCFTDNVCFRHHNRGYEITGRRQLVDFLTTTANDIFPDRQMGPATRLLEAGNTVVREQVWTGTPTVDVEGIGAQGHPATLEICSIYVFDGDRISEYHDYG